MAKIERHNLEKRKIEHKKSKFNNQNFKEGKDAPGGVSDMLKHFYSVNSDAMVVESDFTVLSELKTKEIQKTQKVKDAIADIKR